MNDLAPVSLGIEKVRKRMSVASITDPQILMPAIGGAFVRIRPVIA